MGQSLRRLVYGSEADYLAEWAGVDYRPRNSDGSYKVGDRAVCPNPQYRIPIGTRFGDLIVIGYQQHMSPNTGKSWGWQPLCKCEQCGGESPYAQHNLKAGRSASCNECAKRKASDKRWWKYKSVLPDDQHRSRLLNRLAAAITRCHSKSCAVYKHYGARNVKVFEEWRRDRTKFLQYVQTLEGWDNPKFQMDRIDVNGNYEPGNIRFVSASKNMSNKRRVEDLEARIRYLEQRLKEQVHGTD